MILEGAVDGLVVVVGASVFLTGFLSVRLHASRDRTIGSVEALYGRLEEPALRGENVDQEETGAALVRNRRAVEQATKLDPVSWMTAAFNVVLLGFGYVMSERLLNELPNQDGLISTLGHLPDLSIAELEVLAATATQALVVLLGLVDTVWIASSLRELRHRLPMAALEATFEAINTGDVSGAIKHSAKAVDAAPGFGLAWLWHGDAMAEAGQDRSAVDCFTRALAYGVAGPGPYWHRGLAFARLARDEVEDSLWNAAIDDFSRALELGASRPMRLVLLGLRSDAKRRAGDTPGADSDSKDADQLLRTMTVAEQGEAHSYKTHVPGRRVRG